MTRINLSSTAENCLAAFSQLSQLISIATALLFLVASSSRLSGLGLQDQSNLERAETSEKLNYTVAATDSAKVLTESGDVVPVSKGQRLSVMKIDGDRIWTRFDHDGRAVRGWIEMESVAILGGSALRFDGIDDLVTAPHLAFDQYSAFTIEAWVYDWKNAILCQGQAGDPENSIWLSTGNRTTRNGSPHESCGWENGKGTNYEFAVGAGTPKRWNHVALVYDGANQLLFLNGKRLQANRVSAAGPFDDSRKLLIGAHHYRQGLNFGSGLIDQLRISSSAKYADDFSPRRLLSADSETALLYLFNEGDGKIVNDYSGNGHDGSVVGATWTRLESIDSTTDLAVVPTGQPEFPVWRGRGLGAAMADPNLGIRGFALRTLQSRVKQYGPQVYDSIGDVSFEIGELFCDSIKNGGLPVNHQFETLLSLKDGGNGAVPLFVRLMHSDDLRLKRAGLLALGKMGKPAQPYIEQMASLLDHEDQQVSGAASFALIELGEHTASLAPKVVERLKDQRSGHYAAMILGAMGRHSSQFTPQIIDLLKSNEQPGRVYAEQALLAMGPHAAHSADQIVELLSSNDRRIRTSAISIIASFGDRSKEILPQLVPCLKDEATAFRAIHIFEANREDAGEIVPQIVEMLSHQNDRARIWAAHALLKLKKDDVGPHVRTFVELIATDAKTFRVFAVDMIGLCGEHARGEAEAIAALLESESSGVRYIARSALVRMGEHAKPAIQQVAALLADDDPKLRQLALSTFSGWGEQAHVVVPQIADCLDDPSVAIRKEALNALRAMGRHARPFAKQIGARLDDEDGPIRLLACAALGSLEEDASEYVPRLLGWLSDERREVRESAKLTLLSLGEHVASGLPELTKMAFEDEDVSRRLLALELIAAIGEPSKDIAPKIVALLKHEDQQVRNAADKVLLTISSHSIAFVPTLSN